LLGDGGGRAADHQCGSRGCPEGQTVHRKGLI
jgi:hypothetical protein